MRTPIAEQKLAGVLILQELLLPEGEVDPERLAQSGVGWVLRELSDVEPDRVFGFVTAHRESMSREALRMAAARLSDGQRAQLGITGRRRRR